MHNQFSIESGSRDGTEIRFLLSTTSELLTGKPSGKMITDSDKLSFVYLLEDEQGYSHIHFPQVVWPLMVDVLQWDVDPILCCGEKTLKLIGFKDELHMLIFNIEGNNNYGELFSTAVEKAFEQPLQNTL